MSITEKLKIVYIFYLRCEIPSWEQHEHYHSLWICLTISFKAMNPMIEFSI